MSNPCALNQLKEDDVMEIFLLLCRSHNFCFKLNTTLIRNIGSNHLFFRILVALTFVTIYDVLQLREH